MTNVRASRSGGAALQGVAPPGARSGAFASLALLSPFAIIYACFVLVPIVFGLALSFTKWNGIQPISFVGLDNFVSLASDPHVQKAFGNLFTFVAFDVPIGMVLGLGMALFIDRFPTKVATVLRAVVFMPFVMPLFLTAAIWEWMLVPKFGLFNQLTSVVGLGGVEWLSDPRYMIAGLIIVDQWHGLGFNMLLFYAALKAIPQSTIEAARLDGASTLQEVRYVLIPQLRPILFIVVLLALINTFQIFDLPWLLSKSGFVQGQGGAGGALLFPIMQAVATGLGTLQLGKAAAITTMLLLIIVAVTGAAFGTRRYLRRREP